MQVVAERHVLIFFMLGGSVWLCWNIIYRLLIYPRFLSPLRSVPGPPTGDPIFGRFKDIVFGEAGIPQRNWVKTFGPVVRVVGPIGIEHLIFMKPDALQKILVDGCVEYPKPVFLQKIVAFVAGHGLLTVTGNEHKQMRKAMNPAFSLPNLMAQSDMYYDPIEELIKVLNTEIGAEGESGEGKVLHLYKWLSKVTLDIICDTAFGCQFDSLHDPHNELAKAYETLTSLQTGPNFAFFIFIASIPGSAKFFKTDFAYKHRNWFRTWTMTAPMADVLESMRCIRKISSQMLEERTRNLVVDASNAEAKRDIMSILVSARKAERESEPGAYPMSDEAIMDQVLTFLAAGHETTASGLAWTLWLLAKHPKTQQKLREEVTPLFDEDPRPGYRALKDLQWLDCVIQESLRLMPPAPMTIREAAKTDFIDGVLVPKGTLLYIPIRVVNTWKEVWGEDAEDVGKIEISIYVLAQADVLLWPDQFTRQGIFAPYRAM